MKPKKTPPGNPIPKASNAGRAAKDMLSMRDRSIRDLRLCGHSLGDIVEILEKNGIKNEVSGRPWNKTSVFRVVKKLDEEWRDSRKLKEQYGQHKDRQLAELEKVRARAWKDNDLRTILSVQEREAKLLGLDAALKHEVTGPDGGPVQTSSERINFKALTTDELLQYEAALQKVIDLKKKARESTAK